MSRTIRRKNATLDRPFYVDSYFNIKPHCGWLWENENYSEEVHQKDQRFYHSDKWESNAPKYYRQAMNRSLRAKNKAIIERAIRDFNEEPTFIPFIKDANWNYF